MMAFSNNEDKRASELEKWNPMKEDYENKKFNSYNRGPGAGLTGNESGRRSNRQGSFKLFVGNIPLEMTEDGLSNLFRHVCEIQFTKIMPPRDDFSTTYGFIGVSTVKDGEEAIRLLNGHPIRNNFLKVSFAKEKERTPSTETVRLQKEKQTDWDSAPSSEPPKKTVTFSPATTEVNASTDAKWKPAKPRQLENRYGSTPKPDDSSNVKSPAPTLARTSPGQSADQAAGTAVARDRPVGGSGHLQSLLQKMKRSVQANPEEKTTDLPLPGAGFSKGPGGFLTSAGTGSRQGSIKPLMQASPPLLRSASLKEALPVKSSAGKNQANKALPQGASTGKPRQPVNNRPVAPSSGGRGTVGRDGEPTERKATELREDKETPSKPRWDKRQCMNCGKTGQHKCGRCKGAYCSKECQKQHWPRHRQDCRGDSSSPDGSRTQTPPVRTEVLHTGTAGKFMSRNLPFAVPEILEMVVLVTEVEKPCWVWVQLFQSGSVKGFKEVSSKLEAIYTGTANSGNGKFIPQVGGVCAARYDDCWYRGEIISIIDNSECVVHLFDFGITSVLKLDRLRSLRDELLKLPKQALKCSLSGLNPLPATWSEGMTAKLKALVHSKQCKAKFLKQVPEGWEIELYEQSKPYTQVSSILQPPVPPPPPVLDSVLIGLAVGTQHEILVTKVDSPSCFYAYLVESTVELAAMQVLVNEHCAGTSPVAGYRPNVGELCAARYSADNMWYRAVVASPNGALEDGSLFMTFVDYGNSDVVASGEYRPLEGAQFAALPSQGVPCTLAGVRPQDGSHWSDELTEAFKEWLREGRASFLVRGNLGDKVEVEIFSLDEENEFDDSFNAILEANGFGFVEGEETAAESTIRSDQGAVVPAAASAPRCLPPARTPRGEFEGYVVEVNSPDDFYLQVADKDNLNMLERLVKDLRDRYASPSPAASHSPGVGEACAVLHAGGDSWQRAVVLAYLPSEAAYRVLFVDYGKEELVPPGRIRVLADGFFETPVLAVHCRLTCAPFNNGKWSEASVSYVTDKIHCEKCLINVVREDNKKFTVELRYPGNNGNMIAIEEDLVRRGLAVSTNRELPPESEGQTMPPKVGPSVSSPPASSPPASNEPPTRCVTVLEATPPEEEFLGVVTAVGEQCDVYLQVASEENIETMTTLNDALNSHYAGNQQPPYRPELGEFCAIPYSLDGAWCRAQVVELLPHESSLRVRFVDFGNTEKVSLDGVQRLVDAFAAVPQLALHCSLSGVVAPSGDGAGCTEVASHLSQMVVDKACKGRVMKCDGKSCSVSLHVTSNDVDWLSVNDELISRGLCHHPATKDVKPPASIMDYNPHKPRGTTPSGDEVLCLSNGGQTTSNQNGGPGGDTANKGLSTPEDGELVQLPSTDPPPEEFEGIVTAVGHPLQIHVQMITDENIELIQAVGQELNAYYEQSERRPHAARVGEVCAARYSADGSWYRALVVEVAQAGPTVGVSFVDYGNSEVVRVDDIRRLDGEFLDVPSLAIPCRLSGVTAPSGGTDELWSVAAMAQASSKLLNNRFNVKVVRYDEMVCVVELHDPGDGNAWPALRGSFQSLAPSVKSTAPPVKSTAPSVKSTAPSVKSTAPSVKSTAPSVKSTAPSSAVTNAPSIKARSVPCAALPRSSPINVVFQDVVSTQEMYCQMGIPEEIEKLRALMTDLNVHAIEPGSNAPQYHPTVGDLCLAKFTDDNWYRAEVLKIKQSEQRALIFYVDFGNKEPVSWSRLCAAESRFAQLPTQAVRCGLHGISPNNSASNAVDIKKELTAILMEENSLLQAHLREVSAKNVPLVQLNHPVSGKDINQVIADRCNMSQSATPSVRSQPGVTVNTPQSPASNGVQQPRVKSPDKAAKLKAQILEADRKKRELEEQIDKLKRELDENQND